MATTFGTEPKSVIVEVKDSPIADPGPLGLASFALTTFILSLTNAQILPAAVSALFLPLALFYGGFTQLLAGMWEFKKNNTFGATAFSSYGAFWLALGAMNVMLKLGLISFGTEVGTAKGTFLLGFAIFTLYMWIGTFKVNNALLVTFTLLEIAFVLLILGDFGTFGMNSQAGGYVGLVTAAAAWYASAAGILNPLFKRTLLPVGPRN
jgi:uncharacterized protein